MKQKNKIYAKNHQERFSVEKRTKSCGSKPLDEIFSSIAPFDVLRTSEDHQILLYETQDLALIQEFFKHGGCFRQRVQRRMIVDNNLKMLQTFLDFWEFIPSERSYMLRRGTEEFIQQYLVKKPIGKQGIELVKSRRFSDDFVRTYKTLLNGKAQKVCAHVRNLNNVK